MTRRRSARTAPRTVHPAGPDGCCCGDISRSSPVNKPALPTPVSGHQAGQAHRIAGLQAVDGLVEREQFIAIGHRDLPRRRCRSRASGPGCARPESRYSHARLNVVGHGRARTGRALPQRSRACLRTARPGTAANTTCRSPDHPPLIGRISDAVVEIQTGPAVSLPRRACGYKLLGCLISWTPISSLTIQ